LIKLLLLCESGPHNRVHIIGYRTFLSPIVGNDAFPDNALGLTMRRSDYEFSLLPALEKQLSDNSNGLLLACTPISRQS
jgi:hypothetical protein